MPLGLSLPATKLILEAIVSRFPVITTLKVQFIAVYHFFHLYKYVKIDPEYAQIVALPTLWSLRSFIHR